MPTAGPNGVALTTFVPRRVAHLARTIGTVTDPAHDGRADTVPTTTRAFLTTQVERLEPFDFVVLGTPARPDGVVEVARAADGAWQVRVPGRPPVVALGVPERTELVERGYQSTDPADATKAWEHPATDSGDAVERALDVLTGVFAVALDGALDVGHGSHRARYEAEQQVAAVRTLVEPVLEDALGRMPERDTDGDYFYPFGTTQVVVAPRALPGAPTAVRVFAVTNIGVNVSPELAVFLANLNVQLLFGRWGFDPLHRAVWVDETLLALDLTPAVFRFTLDTVAHLADQFDDQISQMFGGATFGEARKRHSGEEMQAMKPGAGGYL